MMKGKKRVYLVTHAGLIRYILRIMLYTILLSLKANVTFKIAIGKLWGDKRRVYSITLCSKYSHQNDFAEMQESLVLKDHRGQLLEAERDIHVRTMAHMQN